MIIAGYDKFVLRDGSLILAQGLKATKLGDLGFEFEIEQLELGFELGDFRLAGGNVALSVVSAKVAYVIS